MVAHKIIYNSEKEQEAHLPQRNSASATHVFLGQLTDRAITEHLSWQLLYNYRDYS